MSMHWTVIGLLHHGSIQLLNVSPPPTTLLQYSIILLQLLMQNVSNQQWLWSHEYMSHQNKYAGDAVTIWANISLCEWVKYISDEMFTRHETCEKWKDAASGLYRLHWLARHIFQMFCVIPFSKLHTCWKCLMLQQIYICWESCVCVCVCVCMCVYIHTHTHTHISWQNPLISSLQSHQLKFFPMWDRDPLHLPSVVVIIPLITLVPFASSVSVRRASDSESEVFSSLKQHVTEIWVRNEGGNWEKDVKFS
jgi:hypothetical protein